MALKRDWEGGVRDWPGVALGEAWVNLFAYLAP